MPGTVYIAAAAAAAIAADADGDGDGKAGSGRGDGYMESIKGGEGRRGVTGAPAEATGWEGGGGRG